MVKLLGYIVGVLAILLIGIPFAILNGWVLSWLWLWFAVPLGVPALGLVHSIGLSGLVSFMTKQYQKTEDAGEALAFSVLFPFIALLVGYIVHSFM